MIALHPFQRRVFSRLIKNGKSKLSGSPGTGKTLVLCMLTKHYIGLGVPVVWVTQFSIKGMVYQELARIGVGRHQVEVITPFKAKDMLTYSSFGTGLVIIDQCSYSRSADVSYYLTVLAGRANKTVVVDESTGPLSWIAGLDDYKRVNIVPFTTAENKEYPIVFTLSDTQRNVLLVRLGDGMIAESMADTYVDSTHYLSYLTEEDWVETETYVAHQVKKRSDIIIRNLADEEVLVDAIEGSSATPSYKTGKWVIKKLEKVLNRKITMPTTFLSSAY